MICDTFDNILLYCKEGDALHTAITYVRDYDHSQPDGEYEVEGRNVFAKVVTYETSPAEERPFEAHKEYSDVQVLLSGQERMDVAIGQTLEPAGDYDADNDFTILQPADGYSSLIMEPGKFAVFFPEDIHRPGCNVDGTNTVRKICMKVRHTQEN